MAKVSNTRTETQQRFSAIVDALLDEPNVTVGPVAKKRFGSSTLQIGGKIFALVSSKGSFVVKLPKQRVDALEASAVGRRFDPGHGRLMNEWLAIVSGSKADWLALAREAMHYVGKKP